MVAAQQAEIARLKGLKGRPSIKPSGMEKATGPKRGGKASGGNAGVAARSGRVSASRTEVSAGAAPAGSRFKGYEHYLVQELGAVGAGGPLSPRALADAEGETIVAPLAERHPRPFRPGAAPLRADAVPSGPGDAARGWWRSCRRSGSASPSARCMRLLIDRQETFLTESPRGAAGRAGDGGLDHRSTTPARATAAERRLHADRQRRLHLVRHDGQQEPAELPRPAARRPHRLTI